MSSWNLTETQKKLLRWLVQEVRSNNLSEENIWFVWSHSGTSLVGYKGNHDDIPHVEEITLNALTKSGCLTHTPTRQDEYKCALTQKAYDAVYSNFDEPNLSAIPHLIPLTEVEHLDSELWERCRYSLSSGGDDPKAWDKAVRTAVVILEERLRKLGNTESINPDATGETIVNLIFAGKDPK